MAFLKISIPSWRNLRHCNGYDSQGDSFNKYTTSLIDEAISDIAKLPTFAIGEDISHVSSEEDGRSTVDWSLYAALVQF